MIDFNIPKLTEIAEVLLEKNLYDSSMTIDFTVDTQEEMNKLNEDIYFRVYKGDGKDFKKNDIDELFINVIGVKFRYHLKHEDNKK